MNDTIVLRHPNSVVLPARSAPRAAGRRTATALATLAWLAAAGVGAVPDDARAQVVAQDGAQVFDEVAARARALAAEPYRAPPARLPADLAALTYDGHRDIRFRPERALWRDAGLPFEVQFFHPGWLFAQPVRVHEVAIGCAAPPCMREIRVDPRDFDYGRNQFDTASWPALGFAGLRVHYALNSADYRDELVVFLGASYFRALGRGQRYGLSARALAVDTVPRAGRPEAGDYRGEEFPRFTEFWLERPAPAATALTLHALLDSPRVAGAYTFTIAPGASTAVEVRARLFLREGAQRSIATFGIAPLTSMFLHGENQPDDGDFRPEVHDSDGLSIRAAGGEWLWRPLVNPQFASRRGVLTTSFALADPRGFGLMQRDRAFSSYEDLEARYELRPSAWIEPLGDWGAGRVELVQLPTDEEVHDNVVAYWQPDALPAPGAPLDLRWRVLWQMQDEQRPPSAWVTQTRRGRSYGKLAAGEEKFVIDFDGPALRALPADARVEPVVTAAPHAVVREAIAYRHEVSGGWRLALRVQRDPATLTPEAPPLELRAFLRSGNDTLTETWTYLHPVPRP